MKDLNDFFSQFKNLTDEELYSLIDKFGKDKVKKYGDRADIYYKMELQPLYKVVQYLEDYYKNKLHKLIKNDSDKKDKEKLMSVEEVSEVLGVSKVTIYTYIKNKTLTPVVLGEKGRRNIYRFKPSEVERVKNNLE